MNYDILKICEDIEKNGYTFVEKFWGRDTDRKIEEYYESVLEPLIKKTSIDRFGNRNFSLADQEAKNNPFEEIKNSKVFIALYTSILKFNKINIKETISVHNVIALQKNEVETKYKVSSELHFDAFYLTIIIPIKTPLNPDKGTDASLILYPKIRKIASNSLFNYITKFLIQNSLTRYFIKRGFVNRILKSI